MIEIIRADSMMLLPILAEKFKFDMIFLDPPYFEWETGEKKPDHNKLSYYISKLIKPDGVVFLCGTIPQLINDLVYWQRWFNVLFDIILVKSSGTLPHQSFKYPKRHHESIWCMARKETKPSDLKLDLKRTAKSFGKKREVSFRIASKHDDGEVVAHNSAGYMKSVFITQTIASYNVEYIGHPTQKPISLMREIIKFSTEKDNWVLDPFAGSGTTGLACKLEGRNCLMIELEKKYVQMIKKRLSIKTLENFE